MGRPPKDPEERLVTLSVRVPATSLQLLDRIIEGERQYLKSRRLPARGVTRSHAFRTIWELGETEYSLQRATLWVTRRTNRYSVAQAAELLGWDPEALAALLDERGIRIGGPAERPPARPGTGSGTPGALPP